MTCFPSQVEKNKRWPCPTTITPEFFCAQLVKLHVHSW